MEKMVPLWSAIFAAKNGCSHFYGHFHPSMCAQVCSKGLGPHIQNLLKRINLIVTMKGVHVLSRVSKLNFYLFVLTLHEFLYSCI